MTDAGPVIDGYDPDLVDRMPMGGFMERVGGFVIDRVTPDRLEAHLDADERHQQPYGLVHGGVYASIVETMGSVASALRAMADGNIVVGVSNTTDFLRAHRTGRLDCVAEPIHVGRSQQLWQISIRRAADGKDVARGQLRVQVLPADRQLAGRAPADDERDRG